MSTYTFIDKVVVGSGGAASMTLSAIPGTYTDLLFKYTGRRSTSSPYNVRLTFNGSGGTAYSGRYLLTDGSSAFSGALSSAAYIELFYASGTSTTANTFNSTDIYVPEYAGNKNKTVASDMVGENNGSLVVLSGLVSGIWASTSAITSITLTPESGSFVEYSSLYVYGIKKD